MNDQSITATQMQWQPPLLRLTQAPMSGVDEEKETVLYVNPQQISKICRALWWQTFPDGTKSEGKLSTELHCCHFVCYVTESPETVALLRDKALGHTKTLSAA